MAEECKRLFQKRLQVVIEPIHNVPDIFAQRLNETTTSAGVLNRTNLDL
jgi:hypothetical protein